MRNNLIAFSVSVCRSSSSSLWNKKKFFNISFFFIFFWSCSSLDWCLCSCRQLTLGNRVLNVCLTIIARGDEREGEVEMEKLSSLYYFRQKSKGKSFGIAKWLRWFKTSIIKPKVITDYWVAHGCKISWLKSQRELEFSLTLTFCISLEVLTVDRIFLMNFEHLMSLITPNIVTKYHATFINNFEVQFEIKLLIKFHCEPLKFNDESILDLCVVLLTTLVHATLRIFSKQKIYLIFSRSLIVWLSKINKDVLLRSCGASKTLAKNLLENLLLLASITIH